MAAGPPEPEIDGDCWRDGDLLVVRNGATLPKRCIKSNGTDYLWSTTLKQMYLPIGDLIFAWVFLLVIGPLAGLFIRPTKINIRVALTLKHWLLRNVARLCFWASFPLLFLCIIGGFSTKDDALRVFLIILAVLTVVAGRACDTFFVVPVRVKWVRGSFVGITAAHPDYIAALPEWPFVWENGRWQSQNAV
jgi:hypothetical protein